MCGLSGILLGRLAKRRVKDIEALTDTFTKLLLLSEHRGPHATGVAWVKEDGTMQVAKEPLPARAFVQSGAYIDWLLGIDRQVTYLMGHTRWPSYGSVRNPAENHPITLPVGTREHKVAVSHNGSLKQVSSHFSRLQLPRATQVDTELLARLAQRHADEHSIDVEAFLNALTPLDGSMSLALVATSRPEEIILVKGNMPLEVRIHPRTRVLLYASEARIIERALGRQDGWETFPLSAGEALVVNTRAWTWRTVSFTFLGMTHGTVGSYTGA